MDKWTDTSDIRVIDDDGNIIYEGPRFLRCAIDGCYAIVTQGMIEKDGRCERCGGRKTRQAMFLTEEETLGLMTGKYPLNVWESAYVGDDNAISPADQRETDAEIRRIEESKKILEYRVHGGGHEDA